MARQYIIAAAPQQNVEQAIDEILDADTDANKIVLVSTKQYRHPRLTNYDDINADSFDEKIALNIHSNDHVTIIQFNQTLISYVNVYRLLRANGVKNFTIKVAGKPLINTSIEQVFANFSRTDNALQDNVSWINPATISLRHEFAPAYHGQVIDGDWDLETTDFEQSVLFFASFKQRIEKGTDWKKTEYYIDVANSIRNAEPRFGCQSLEALDAHCEKLDRLYLELKQKGWQQQENSDFVSINIGRNGQIIFNDGRHRLTMAKLLKLDKIPVKIAVRHAQWVEFKNEIKAFADKFYDGKVYARINHVDLSELRFSQEDERLEVISSHIGKGNKTVLDIGTHWGYFCNGLEEKGYDCTGVEADVANFYFLDKLRLASGKKFTALSRSIFDVVTTTVKFDVVLALNIFHHFIKTKEKHVKLVGLLNNLEMNEMYLQTHNPDEPQMVNSYKNYSAYEFARFIIENTCLNHIELLVDYDSGRKLFKLSR